MKIDVKAVMLCGDFSSFRQVLSSITYYALCKLFGCVMVKLNKQLANGWKKFAKDPQKVFSHCSSCPLIIIRMLII